MKKLLIILLVLTASAAAGLAMSRHPGYMLLAIGPYRIETTLWFGLVALMVVMITLHIIWQLLHATLGMGDRFRRWNKKRKRHKSHTLTIEGLCELAEGHWERAEKTLIRAAKHSDTPLMNYLAAAKAAQEQGALTQRDHYLKLAIESTPHANKAVGLTQAELQLKAGQYEQALASLQTLRQQHPKHQHVLLLLKDAYLELHDWDQLYDLLPALKRHHCCDKHELTMLQRQIGHQRLAAALHARQHNDIQAIWRNMHKDEQQDLRNVLPYVDYLLAERQHTDAEKILRAYLQQHWEQACLARYAVLDQTCAAQALKQGERWLDERPQDAALLDCLSQLSKTLTLWGKAKAYLIDSIAIQPSAHKHFALAALHHACDETQGMQQHILDGLQATETAQQTEVRGKH